MVPCYLCWCLHLLREVYGLRVKYQFICIPKDGERSYCRRMLRARVIGIESVSESPTRDTSPPTWIRARYI
ncbi:hypothetical protein OBBRIDRAFT_506610 [Obba rivulosa]|uniref:Secreted protein n=1 Tax=Obba rivulosa TaxID=1052685 RepID=A0A8E2B4W0_9APHY|nr:hypothetical protein OBBRIDRAFT_506610 [Obba rivulosa]